MSVRLIALLGLVLLPGLASSQQCSVVVENKTASTLVVHVSVISGARVIPLRPQVVQSDMESTRIILSCSQIVITLYNPRVPSQMVGRARFTAPRQGLKVALQPSSLRPGRILLKPVLPH